MEGYQRSLEWVVLKEENLPPLKWSLGRIVKLHPGLDGVNARVVSVRTSTGILIRPVAKVCILSDPAPPNHFD